MAASVAVERGSILAYRVFDAGDTIALDVAETFFPGAKRIVLGGPLVEGIVIAVQPVEIPLDDCELQIPGIGPLVARTSARIFDFGAISILYEMPIEPGTTVEALTPLCAALYESPVLDEHGAELRRKIMTKLGSTVAKPHRWEEAESFTIVFIEALRGGTAFDMTSSEAVAKLLLGEPSTKPLSATAREDVLKNAFSYLADDLVLVDWNSAVVVEPSASRVVAKVLELATCQLLEFRYYDELLDRELLKVYDEVEKAPRIFRSPFRAASREVLRRLMELTEFTERVDNAIKLVGDFYLARVYLAAIRRSRVPEWRESVETKLSLVGRAYTLLKGEVEVSRTQLLELTVVILILVEVLAAFQRH
jgi:hypothetical protein